MVLPDPSNENFEENKKNLLKYLIHPFTSAFRSRIICVLHCKNREGIMSRLPQISEAEYEVMKVIWSKVPISTNEVTDILLEATDWSPKTIQTC